MGTVLFPGGMPGCLASIRVYIGLPPAYSPECLLRSVGKGLVPNRGRHGNTTVGIAGDFAHENPKHLAVLVKQVHSNAA